MAVADESPRSAEPSGPEVSGFEHVESSRPSQPSVTEHYDHDRPSQRKSPPARAPSPHDDPPSTSSHTKQASSSAPSSSSSSKQYKSSSSKHQQQSSSRSSHRPQSSSYASHHPPRDYSSAMDIGASLSREFRGTSPCVIENIASHPLLYSGGFEPLRHPSLSARSRKVIRQASDLAYTAPGLKNLLEVCRESVP